MLHIFQRSITTSFQAPLLSTTSVIPQNLPTATIAKLIPTHLTSLCICHLVDTDYGELRSTRLEQPQMASHSDQMLADSVSLMLQFKWDTNTA
jgi:hypothetical protein